MSHTQEWLKQFGSNSYDATTTMLIGSDNSIFIMGYTLGDLGGTNEGDGTADVFVAKYNANGDQIWLKQFGSNNSDEPKTMLIGSDNSIFIMGDTQGDVDGQGTGTHAGVADVFVAKYNADNGHQIWLKQFGSNSNDILTTMLIGSDNSIFIMGYTYGDVDGTGTGTYEGDTDVFVAKYNTYGDQIWLKQFGSSNGDVPTTMVIGSDNSIFIMGYTYGDVDGTGTGTNAGNGTTDVFVAKYNTDNGEQIWLKQIGSNNSDAPTTMLIGSDNSIFIMGYTGGNLGGANAGNGTTDVFVAKYNANGDQIWLKQFGSNSYDSPTTMLIGSDNSIFIMGYTQDDVDGTGTGTYAGSVDVFVAKYNANGHQIWLKQFGSINTDSPITMLIGSDNSIFITGYTGGNLGGTNAGSVDVFVAKYNTDNGDQIWLKQFGSNNTDSPTTMLIGSDNSIFIMGKTYGDVDGTGTGTYAGNGAADVFVAKYNANGDQIWLKQFGSSDSDDPTTMLIGSDNSIFIMGYTFGDLGGTNAGGVDAFITKYSETTNSETITTLVGFRYSSNMIFSTKELRSFKPTMFSSEDAYSMSWKISPKQLPAGIEFNKRTGKIIGTPTAKFDEQTFTVFATSSDNISARYAFKMKCE